MKVKSLLEKEEFWTQGSFARDKDDMLCRYDSYNAVKWCLQGSIFKCYGDDYGIVCKVHNYITKTTCAENIADFNDYSTYQEVYSLVNELDI